MPFIRSSASERCAYIVSLILLLGVIMLIYSYYAEKKLVCVIIIVSFSHQPSSCFKCIKLNIHSFYDVHSVSNTEYVFFMCFCSL